MHGRAGESGRFCSLDGLRGVAAVVVLIHHALLLTPGYSAVVLHGAPMAFGSPSWWIVGGPVRVSTAGAEAVTVFFVLSGLVLTLPLVRRGRPAWARCYPQRIVRLGVLVVASLALAAMSIVRGRSPRIPAGQPALVAPLGARVLPRAAALRAPRRARGAAIAVIVVGVDTGATGSA